MSADRKVGQITVGGRLFEIEFWSEQLGSVELPWYRVSEIRTETYKPIFGKEKQVTVRNTIKYAWTDQNRLESAKHDIDMYLYLERQKQIEADAIEDFCRHNGC